MEAIWLYSSLSIIFLLLAAFKFISPTTTWRRRRNLPPSPFALPIIGHLNLLKIKNPLHQTLHTLSQKHGQIFSLRFGSRLVFVVSSPSAIQECFTKNDIVLANRPRLLSGKYIGYNYNFMSNAPYGDHWRNLRRITTLELFSSTRLNKFLESRRDEIKLALRKLHSHSSNGFARVELRTLFTDMTFNIIMRMLVGKKYCGEDADLKDTKRFREIMREYLVYNGASNPGDFLSFLQWFDYQGLEKRLKRLGREFDMIVQASIEDHRSRMGKGEILNSMVYHLLSLQQSEPEYYTDAVIKGLVLNMILAGFDTTTETIEWTMSALLNHPEVLKKVRAEIDIQIGQDRFVDEPDISNLHYLQCVILESLRLYPAGPLALPHFSSDDSTIGGYDMPRDILLLVNLWAFHRDPEVFEDPLSFKPERFEIEGEKFKILPFGMGRRSCPGSPLANRVINLTVALFIQCFEWERVGEELIDMTEAKGITMPKVVPLEALCKSRDIMNKLFCQSTVEV